MIYSVEECFTINGDAIEMTMNDFWRWFCSNLSDNNRRDIISKFIVASAIGLSSYNHAMWNLCKSYDLMTTEGYRVKVESASYIQSDDGECPFHISFPVSSRTADVYVFCLFKATTVYQTPLNLDVWEFFALSANELPEKRPLFITLPRLMNFNVCKSGFYGIADAITNAMDA